MFVCYVCSTCIVWSPPPKGGGGDGPRQDGRIASRGIGNPLMSVMRTAYRPPCKHSFDQRSTQEPQAYSATAHLALSKTAAAHPCVALRRPGKRGASKQSCHRIPHWRCQGPPSHSPCIDTTARPHWIAAEAQGSSWGDSKSPPLPATPTKKGCYVIMFLCFLLIIRLLILRLLGFHCCCFAFLVFSCCVAYEVTLSIVWAMASQHGGSGRVCRLTCTFKITESRLLLESGTIGFLMRVSRKTTTSQWPWRKR